METLIKDYLRTRTLLVLEIPANLFDQHYTHTHTRTHTHTFWFKRYTLIAHNLHGIQVNKYTCLNVYTTSATNMQAGTLVALVACVLSQLLQPFRMRSDNLFLNAAHTLWFKCGLESYKMGFKLALPLLLNLWLTLGLRYIHS